MIKPLAYILFYGHYIDIFQLYFESKNMTEELFDVEDRRRNTQFDAEITVMFRAGLNGYRITRNLWKVHNGVKVIAYNTVYSKIKRLKKGNSL